MECECIIAAGKRSVFCPRRSVHVTQAMHAKCSNGDGDTIDNLFSAPRPTADEVRERKRNGRRASAVPGVGDHMRDIIGESWFTSIMSLIRRKGCGSCQKLQQEMNGWGPHGCEHRRQQIIAHVHENARLPDTPLTHGTVDGWLTEAIARFRKAQVVRKPARRRGVFAMNGSTPRFITSAQMQSDIKTLIGKVPHTVTAVAGVARSGLAAATMISMYLHLPMFTIRQNSHDIQQTGNGWRLGGGKHIEPGSQHVLVVDDTVMTGNSLKAIRGLLTQFKKTTTAAVYVNPTAKIKPDIWAVELPWPHLLEWNLFNSVLSPNMALDFDGILCHDCPSGSDDDGEKYLQFIRTARPLYVPRKVQIPLIVTARIEKYRAETVAWMQRHGITCKALVMHPATNLQERNRDNITAYKARHFMDWAIRHRAKPEPLAFIESDDRQAIGIAKISGRMVICPASAKVYQ